jgi:hypothetical protein
MKPIENFPGYWIDEFGVVVSSWEQVSNGFGFVSVMRDDPIKTLTQHTTRGYRHVTLYRDKRPTVKRVHVLVLETFVGKRPKGLVARHLNSNSADNRLVNLQWSTPKENRSDISDLGHDRTAHFGQTRKLTDDDILVIRSTPKRKHRTRDLAIRFNVHPHYIDRVIAGSRRQYS